LGNLASAKENALMPIVAAAIITGGAALAGGAMQANAAKKAAQANQRATDASLALQRDQYNQTRADQEPWRQAGVGALGRLQNPLASFEASPDYNFRMSEGLKAVNQNRATAGLLQSGSALRGVSDYAQNTAAGEYGDWWNRQSGLAGVGQAANSANQQAGSQYANNSQNALMNNAGVQGSSYMNQANAWAQGLGGAAGAVGWGLNNFPMSGTGAAASKGASRIGGYAGGWG
jgi:hypothetical protein